jgi:hypothetical protein
MYAATDTLDQLDLTAVATDIPLEELYDAWCAARDEARFAYDEWCDAPWPERGEAYAVYVAAADREQAAAELYRRSVSTTRGSVSSVS